MTQQIINVGAAPNDGQGDPLRTSFIKCNDNFSELYSRVQVDPPASLIGSIGDVAGMIAYDSNFLYYCFANYDGISEIWNKVPNTDNAQVTQLTATGNITTSGNVTAAYLYGDGSNITGVTAAAPTAISFGNSNVSILSSGNIVMFANIAGFPIVNITGTQVGQTLPTLVEVAANLSVTGFASVSNLRSFGQGTFTGNVNALSGLVVTANTTTGNLTVLGNIASDANINGNLRVTGTTTLTGNILGNVNYSGNVNVAGGVTAVGNIAGNYIIGDGGLLSNITAVSNVAVTLISNGTSSISTPTSGGNAVISIGGVSNTVVFTSTGTDFIGNITAVGNVTAANVTSNGVVVAVGNVSGGNITTSGIVQALGNVSAANISTSGLISAVGNVNAGNFFTSGTATVGSLNLSGNIVSVANITGNLTAGNITSVSAVSAGTTITAVGNITGGNISTSGVLSSGNVSAANISASGAVTATGNISGGNITTTGLANVANLQVNNSVTIVGNITGGNLAITASAAVTGNLTAGNIFTPGIANVIGNIITDANVIANVAMYTPVIVHTGPNATGNIGAPTDCFNFVFANTFSGQATSAQYADLAECYLADEDYAAGTVLSFGGTAELTISLVDGDTKIAGVVSTSPAYKMNAELDGEHVVALALTGRVPCRVQGPVERGDMMVSAGNGRARAEKSPVLGSVIGKALESFDGDIGTIEVVVGRL